MPSVSVTGLASGVDTGAIIASLMAVERRPLSVLQGRADLAAARVAGFEGIRTRLEGLRTAGDALRAPAVFAPRPIATSSDSARVSATAGSGAVQASFAVAVSTLARAHVTTQSTAMTAAAASDTLHLNAGSGPVDVAIGIGDTIATIASKVNGAGAGVTAAVVEGKLRLTAASSGTAHAISVTSDGSLAANLDLTTTLAAQDAQFTVDGVAHVRSSNTVTDVVPGVTLSLRGATAGGSVTIASDPAAVDVDGIVAKARTFVTSYNDSVDALRRAVAERPERGGPPARGALFGDDLTTGVLARLNRAVHDPVAGLVSGSNQAAAVGISTGASTGALASEALSGRLVLNEQKLRDAIAADPGSVEALLSGDDPLGVVGRVQSVVAGLTGSAGSIAGRITSESASAAGYRASIEQASIRLGQREDRLRSQFTAMERTLGQLRDTQSRLGAQLGLAF